MILHTWNSYKKIQILQIIVYDLLSYMIFYVVYVGQKNSVT